MAAGGGLYTEAGLGYVLPGTELTIVLWRGKNAQVNTDLHSHSEINSKAVH